MTKTVGELITDLQKLPVNDSVGFNVTINSYPMSEEVLSEVVVPVEEVVEAPAEEVAVLAEEVA